MNEVQAQETIPGLKSKDGQLCPSRPRLVLRAGFAGRRELSEREEERLTTALQRVLNVLGHELSTLKIEMPVTAGRESHVARFYSDTPPLLRLITGLCEGADTVGARVLETLLVRPGNGNTNCDSSDDGKRCLETELAAVLPFSVEDYRTSRSAEHLPEFERQLARCAWVLELDGIYDKPNDAALNTMSQPQRDAAKSLADHRRARGYRAQSAFVLRHSDLLIAAGNPVDAGNAGGTLETVRAALEFELPVVFIHTGKDTENIYLLEPEVDFYSLLSGTAPDESNLESRLQGWVRQLTADSVIGIEPESHTNDSNR